MAIVPPGSELSVEYSWSTPYGRRSVLLPSPQTEVIPGVLWGAPYEAPSPAYWAMEAALATELRDAEPVRVGVSLVEQYAYCLLCGYGSPSEFGIAMFERLRERHLLDHGASIDGLMLALEEPLAMGSGKLVRYRFARQRAGYLAQGLADFPPALEHALPMRVSLISLPGIGLKTASWIVRDWYGSDDVAVLDVHIVGACRAMNVFPRAWEPARDYSTMERQFLRFAQAIGVRASILDNVMWREVRTTGKVLKATA